jgi:hypothetical protein
MADLTPFEKFSVILNFPPESLYAKMLAPISGTVRVTEGGQELHYLSCSEVDSTHYVYLFVTAHKPTSHKNPQESQWTMRLQIPHQHVLMILEPAFAEKGLLGFQT